MEKTKIYIKKGEVLSGDNIVAIILAIKDLSISVIDNYKQIKVAEIENSRAISITQGKSTCQKK